MKLVWLSALFLSLSLGAKAPSEEIYTCSGGDGEVVARLFLDPQIFCENNPKNDAVLLKESENGGSLFSGELFRRASETGEDFSYAQIIDGLEYEIALSVPYGKGTGFLSIVYDDVIHSREELNCVMKQVHVACD